MAGSELAASTPLFVPHGRKLPNNIMTMTLKCTQPVHPERFPLFVRNKTWYQSSIGPGSIGQLKNPIHRDQITIVQSEPLMVLQFHPATSMHCLKLVRASPTKPLRESIIDLASSKPTNCGSQQVQLGVVRRPIKFGDQTNRCPVIPGLKLSFVILKS